MRETSLVNQPYLILSISANALVASASRAGISVYTIDCFSDLDTAEKSLGLFQLRMQNSFSDLAEIEKIIQSIPEVEFAGVVIGSGFEQEPELLTELACYCRIYANSPDVIQTCSDPELLFPLLKKNDIIFPDVRYSKPDDQSEWLLKQKGACGGGHIRRYENTTVIDDQHYLQRFCQGDHYSVNFLAAGGQVNIIGCNKTWCSQHSVDEFSYGGAISRHMFEPGIILRLQNILDILTTEIGLVGLCGIDFILTDNNKVVLLDINPRPTASLELYDDPSGDLFTTHMQAFEQQTLGSLPVSSVIKAHEIIYSQKEFEIPTQFTWPDWVICRPKSGTLIKTGQPVCTVLAEGVNPDEILSCLGQRTEQIRQNLLAKI